MMQINILRIRMAGRTVLRGNLGVGQTVSAQSLPTGNYVLRITEAAKGTQTFSFSKQ